MSQYTMTRKMVLTSSTTVEANSLFDAIHQIRKIVEKIPLDQYIVKDDGYNINSIEKGET